MRIPFFSRGSTGPPSVISPPASDPAGEAAIDSAGDGDPAETTNGAVVVQTADLAPDDPLALFDAEDPSEGPPRSARAPRHDAGPHGARVRVTVGAADPERPRAPKVRPDLPLQVSVPETDLAPANGHGTPARDAHAPKAIVPDRFRAPEPPALAPAPDPLLARDTVLEPLPPRSAADRATPARTPVPPAPSPAPAGPPLSLDTVLLRRTPIQWPEAVAIVDAACARLVRPDGTERPAPDLPGIFLHADGTVEVNDGVAGEASAVRLARTLHALAGAQAMPAPLRLLITKWVGSGGTHTLLEFAAELSYFARPDGQALVRALYERSAATPPPAPAAPNLDGPVLVDAREYERAAEFDTEPLHQPHRRPFRLSWVLPAILSIATAGAAAGMWLTTLIPGRGAGEPAPSQESPAVLSAGVALPDPAIDLAGRPAGVVPPAVETDSQLGAPFEAVEPGNSAVGGVDPRATTRSAAAAPPVRPAAPSSRAPSGGAASGFPPPLAASPPPVSTTAANVPGVPASSDAISAPLAPPPAPRLPPAGPPPTANGGGSARPGPAAAALEENTPAPALDTLAPSAIYTPSDRDVQPPRLVYPQLPPPPTSGPDTAINTLEVVVDRNGRVEQVRLVSIPVRLTDMTLLSNAKNWRFEPALREGQPVRYRMRVSWATTP